MEPRRLTGPESGALKYDLLTALAIVGLSGTATEQMTMMRLIALITARYNWQLDELTVGQREMARMWQVNERTVKREIKRLTQSELLICKRQGVRGRVGAYRLNTQTIARISDGLWGNVGPDFDQRMRLKFSVGEPKVVQIKDYASPQPGRETKPAIGKWARVIARLRQDDPGICDAWFARLNYVECGQGTLRLSVPSRFIRSYIETHLLRQLTVAAEDELGPIERIIFDG